MNNHKIVHRDLSARNLLVGHHSNSYTVKITDFGLSRSMENEYYTLSSDSKFPVKWTAPVRPPKHLRTGIDFFHRRFLTLANTAENLMFGVLV